jgi:hypothetical protein
MRDFEGALYDAMCSVYPGTTVRSISQALGMSDGYWSSLQAQGLCVSTTALVHLSEHLDAKKLLLEAGSNRLRKLEQIQSMIAREIVQRFTQDTESLEGVWQEVESAVSQNSLEPSGGWGAMPFVIVHV